MKSFDGKVAAITGAGSGIGRALALRLAAQQCALSLSDVNPDGLAETAALAVPSGVKVTTARVDASSREQVAAWAEQTVLDHGRVNLIFNNAGIAYGGTVATTDYTDYERVMNINFWGVIYGTKAFLPHLEASGDGHVINVSSAAGLFAQPMMSAYNASKFAVRGFSESLRQELDLAKGCVSASCVHPGGIKTNIVRNAHMDASVQEVTGRDPQAATASYEKTFFTTADQAAKTILTGVRRNARRILIGADARAYDALQRSAPGGYQALLTTALRLART